MLFTKEEYKQRLNNVQKMMQEKGIELLISHDTNNINYLTGYDAWSFYCLLYTSPSPRDMRRSRMPSSA